MIAQRFNPPTPSWVLTGEDQDRLPAWIAQQGMSFSAFTNTLAHTTPENFWNEIIQRPKGMPLGPYSWTETKPLYDVIDAFQPWEERIATYTAWEKARLQQNTLGVFVSETAMLSMIGPNNLTVDDRNQFLQSPNGFWWALFHNNTLQDMAFLGITDIPAIQEAMRKSHFAVCWTQAEKRFLERRLFGWTGHLEPLEPNATNKTAWQHLDVSEKHYGVDCIENGLRTLATLATHPVG